MEPAEEVVLPATQLTHCVPSLVPLHLPTGHEMQVVPSDVAPEPTAQSRFEVQPVWSSRANGAEPGQAVQEVMPGVEVYVAPVQSLQVEAEPSELPDVPTGQLMLQSSGESWASAVDSSVVILPAGQEVQSISEDDLYEPKGQTLQS